MGHHRKIKWITLDVFGTLFQFDHVLKEASEKIVDREGLKVSPEDFYSVWKQKSKAQEWDKKPYRKMAEWFGESLNETFAHFNHKGRVEKGVNVNLSIIHQVKLYPDADFFLEQVHGPFKICLLTNCDNQELHKVLFHHKLQFDGVMTSEMAGAYKPDRKIFDAALSFIETPIEEVIHIGDSPYHDVYGAKNAQMLAYWLNRCDASFPSDMPKPDAEFKNLIDIARYMKELS